MQPSSNNSSATDPALNFVLCWHMHQPWYQQGIGGDYSLPWVYLHAIKDYEDMAMHLESHPAMHVVVNFAPILLEQLDDYARQLKAWLDDGTAMKDPMLNLLAGVTPIPESPQARFQLLGDCRRANAEKMIHPYAAFKDLLQPFEYLFKHPESDEQEHKQLSYLENQYFIDVLVWYHIAWLGHSLKQTTTSATLIDKANRFDATDRRSLLQLIHDCIASLIPRYRQLAERGQIELAMSPYCHPIIPLLNDMDNMACSQAEAPRPASGHYPGGKQRSRWHIEQGIACFEQYFGMRPKGIWLSEGAVSDDAIALVDEYDFEWTASGEGVWRNSMHLGDQATEKVTSKRALFHPYKIDGLDTKMYFRDDGLSDLIGFDYSKRNSVDAADDLVQNLVNIADFLGDSAPHHVVSIILDGENAWEYYPHNGYYFLDHLYATLADHPSVKPTTFSSLGDSPKAHDLEKLCPGSWVYGSFSTWIGETDKNLAWDRLVEAKLAYDEVIASGKLDDAQRKLVDCQLAVCEGSDWFWWFGAHNPSESVSSFDLLYRMQLKNLYELLQLAVPENLNTPISVGGGDAENAGTMVRNV